MATFNATFAESDHFNASFSESNNFAGGFGEVQYVKVGDYYDGDYSATPSEGSQTIPTALKLMAHDFVIQPIPSNYGRISWNGSTLSVY